MNDYYYGLPQEQWDNLILKAEDMLHDEGLGNHLVGVYPIGNRLFGLEAESPGVMCLYVNGVEELLDPEYAHGRASKFRYFHEGYCNNPVVMVDLFEWVHWLLTEEYGNWKLFSFCNIIPCYGDVIHQDDSIISIIEAAAEFLKEREYGLNLFRKFDLCLENSLSCMYPPTYLFLRTHLALRELNRFNPNICSSWGTIIQAEELGFPKELVETDHKILSLYENNIIPDREDLNKLISYVRSRGFRDAFNFKEEAKDSLRKAVIDFYRFQL